MPTPKAALFLLASLAIACGSPVRPSTPSAVPPASTAASPVFQSPFVTPFVTPASSDRRPLEVQGPRNLTASVAGSTVTLSWDPPSTVVTVLDYVIDVRSGPSSPIVTNAPSGGRTSFVAPGVPPGTYYVSVRAQLPGGFTDPSNQVAVTVSGSSTACTAAPGAPSGLSGSATGATLALSWGAASGSPGGYLVDAGSGPGLSNLASGFDVGAGTSLSAPNLPQGTYYIRVRAKNSCGTGPASNEIAVTVTGGTSIPTDPRECTAAPAAPTNLRATASGGTITLTWTEPAGEVEGNLLDVGTAPGLSDLGAGREVGPESPISAPNQPNGTYYLRLRAHNRCGTSPPSAEASVVVAGGTTIGTCSSAPTVAPTLTVVSAPVGPGATFTFSWTAVPGATDYLLSAGSAPGLTNISSGTPQGNRLVFSGPMEIGTYFLRVRGVNSCGSGPASNEVQVTSSSATTTTPCTTAPDAPAGLIASLSVDGVITLTWSAPSASVLVHILDMGTRAGGSDVISNKPLGPEPMYRTSPNQLQGTYYMRLRAQNACGISPTSTEVSITVVTGPTRTM